MTAEAKNHDSIGELRVDLVKQDTLLNALADDLRIIATTIKEVAEANHQANQELRTTIEENIKGIRLSMDSRANHEKSRTLSMLAIIVPIIVGIFGVLWLSINYVSTDVRVLYDVRVGDAYKDGIRDGQVGERLKRIERLEREVDDLLHNRDSAQHGPKER